MIMDRHREMLEELENCSDQLSGWEVDFVDSLQNWDGDFTERQEEVLEDMYDNHCTEQVRFRQG